MNVQRPTICLNMIVKNEEHVIRRCLESVLPLIDHWVIVDTGSSDATKEIIRDIMKDKVPGTLYERPWVNFGHNRTEALKLCEGLGDYIFTIDADEVITCDEGFSFGNLTGDWVTVIKTRQGHEYRFPMLLRAACDWRWEGVIHEHPNCDNIETTQDLKGISVASPREGARSRDPNTYRRDALMLEADLMENPGNPRTVFYLAQSYRDAQDYDNALKYYRQRLSMGGWQDEHYISLFQIGVVKRMRGDPWPECLDALLTAQAFNPGRIEPLFEIGMYYSGKRQWVLAWMFLELAANAPRADPRQLFIESDLYDWRARLEAAVAAYWVGNYAEATRINEDLLASGLLPDNMRSLVEKNLSYSKEPVQEA